MKRTLAGLLGACLVSLSPLHAQLTRPGEPLTARVQLAGERPVHVLAAPDVVALRAEDEARGDRPFRYGAPLVTSLDADRVGRWDQAPDGTLAWRIEIASPGAYSLGVLFDVFDLPPGGQVFLYDPERETVVGALTEENEQPNGMLAVQPIPGDRVVVEYVQGPRVRGAPQLRIGALVHDYRDILANLSTAPSLLSMSCLVDINCPAGDPYQDLKRSVVEVLVGGAQCSAALLNNTAEDGTPYLYTANHCGDMTNVLAIFNYELPECGSGSGSFSQTLSGATHLASTSGVDSQLFVFNSPPPASYQVFYAGWGRGNQPGKPAVGISHPAGNPKKITIDDSAPVKTGNSWLVQWELGLTLGGSSGSPLFNKYGRVIGCACCVTDFTCMIQQVWYNRFNRFWSLRNLGQWLDPSGMEALGVDGYDPFHAQVFEYNGGGSNPKLTQSVTLPAFGTNWVVEIDAAGHPGATSTLLRAHAVPSSGTFLPAGELLIDLSSAFHLQSIQPIIAGLSTHTIPIPGNEPSLAGFLSYAQGAILGGGGQLTNGLKVRVNAP